MDLSNAALEEVDLLGSADPTAAPTSARRLDFLGADTDQAIGWELDGATRRTELPGDGACLLGHPVG